MNTTHLVGLFVLASSVWAGTAGDLEKLKKEFPAHLAGPVTRQSEPSVQRYFNKYRTMVMAMTTSSLPDDITGMRREIQGDIFLLEHAATTSSSATSSAAKFAAKQNLNWIKQKLVPYLRRIETLQRRPGQSNAHGPRDAPINVTEIPCRLTSGYHEV